MKQTFSALYCICCQINLECRDGVWYCRKCRIEVGVLK